MFRIAVCDDDLTICNQIENIFRENSEIESRKISIEVFMDGVDLYKHLENERGYFDLIFLDISMPSLDGITLAKYIREEKADHLTKIVFVSSYEQYWKDFLGVEPIGFINKPVNDVEVITIVRKAMYASRLAKNQFSFTNGNFAFRIDHADILFLQKNNRKIHVYYYNEKRVVSTASFYGQMTHILHTLDNRNFIVIHKSCIVNYTYIRDYQYAFLSLINGQRLEISQSKRKDVRNYIMKRIGEN